MPPSPWLVQTSYFNLSYIHFIFECIICLAITCEATSVGLVRYPATQAPVSGTSSVNTQCTENALRTSGSGTVTCNADGSWTGQNVVCEM